MENEKKNNFFFKLIMGISFLLVATLGVTYAYFSAKAIDEENGVNVKSGSIRLRFISYESAWSNNSLIPVNTEIAEYSFEHQDDTTIKDIEKNNNSICKDDNGDSICSIYVFQVKNITDSKQGIMMELESTSNGFYNLNSMLYELKITNPEVYNDNSKINDTKIYNGINDPTFYKSNKEIEEDASSGGNFKTKINVLASDGNLADKTIGTAFLEKEEEQDPRYVYYSPIYVNRKGVEKNLLSYKDENEKRKLSLDLEVPSLGDKIKIADEILLNKDETKTFAMVFYIKDSGKEQTNQDSLKTFTGTILVNKGDGSNMVTGTLNVFDEDEEDENN